MPLYDTIGQSYNTTRRPDRRIVDALVYLLALPERSLIADIGAGTGNYTNALADRNYRIQAVEPSATMRRQAVPHPNVTWVDGTAESIPLGAGSVDAVVSTLATHHFPDLRRAFTEMARVAKGGPIAIFTFDYRQIARPWLADYFPSVWQEAVASTPPVNDVRILIQTATGRSFDVHPFILPPDLSDLFLIAGWQRPAIYLDPVVRAGMSIFATSDAQQISEGVARLSADLESGRWREQYGTVDSLSEIDGGYRFVLARPN